MSRKIEWDKIDFKRPCKDFTDDELAEQIKQGVGIGGSTFWYSGAKTEAAIRITAGLASAALVKAYNNEMKKQYKKEQKNKGHIGPFD